MDVTIGGNRLGSGNNNKVWMRDYERSTHDLGYVWRSTMAAGTLVPFMSELALPGDTFDIDLNVDILTHPTIGPLFGSFKVQLDVFQAPIRLYQGKLHMNMLGIGMNMSNIKFPQVLLTGPHPDVNAPIDNQQINGSCIFSYLGIRGLGHRNNNPANEIARKFNAIPYLAYWEIYKNYYANKQEEVGYVIHKSLTPLPITLTGVLFKNTTPNISVNLIGPASTYLFTKFNTASTIEVIGNNVLANFNPNALILSVQDQNGNNSEMVAGELFTQWDIIEGVGVIGSQPVNWLITGEGGVPAPWGFGLAIYDNNTPYVIDKDAPPQLTQFDLNNIDTMRQEILAHVMETTEFNINSLSIAPYGLPMQGDGVTLFRSIQFPQEGLGIKTYQSDLFNNWIQTDWIDGVDGISAVTAIDTTGGSFTIDELNLSKKIYDMLNRIAISGGSYDDWLDAVYTHERTKSIESPMYLGGLMTNLVFQEIVSTAETGGNPLGTLAGRGKVTGNQKGGHVVAKVDEPSYLIGIISLTPRVDYSQGNKWDMNLKTMNDLHKPALDAIGYQDLITDQMAWFDTIAGLDYNPIFKSAGKQPAWINYMTNVNRVLGNFADQTQQMFMVLNRRYNVGYNAGALYITDLTTYIDPTKFNHIFADTRLDAQNFWAQVGVNITARRKMSAKVIPNL